MILTIVLCGFILIAIWIKSSPFYWWVKGVHWLIPLPVIGNTGLALIKPYGDFWLSFYKRTEGHKIVGYHFFTQPAILARDPEIIKQVTITDTESFKSRGIGVQGIKNDPFTRSILITSGDEWKHTRSKITPFFSPAKLKKMIYIIEEVVNGFVSYLESECANSIDVDIVSLKLTTDLDVALAFGIEPDSFTNPNSFFFELKRELVGYEFGLRTLIGILSPTLYSAFNLTWFRKSTNKKLCGFINQVLEARARGEGVRPDFIQGMFELHKNETQEDENQITSETGIKRIASFDKEGVMAQAMTIFVGSTDTTGHTLGFTMYELAMNQHIQDRLREEILCFDSNNNGKCDYDEIMQMVYLDMVICEVLRKYPALPMQPRICTRSTVLGNVKISEGTRVIIPIMGVHWDPKYYPNPEIFDPERFAPGTQRESGTYIPFGLGPRTCIGRRLTKIEMKLTLCKVLRKFRLTPCEETPEKITDFGFGPVLCPKGGLKISFKPLTEN